jgi:hypothetical protein
MAAYPGINYEWNPVSKPRLRLVVAFFGRYFECYIRFRPAYQPPDMDKPIKRRLFINFRTYRPVDILKHLQAGV